MLLWNLENSDIKELIWTIWNKNPWISPFPLLVLVKAIWNKTTHTHTAKTLIQLNQMKNKQFGWFADICDIT